MIQLFRISLSEHINDMTGTGAKIYGGRWNHAGYPVVYASGSRSLAALEFLVHVPMALAPDNLSIAEINIQKKITRLVDLQAMTLPIVGVHEIFRLRGFDFGYPRPPLKLFTGEQRAKLKQGLIELGLL